MGLQILLNNTIRVARRRSNRRLFRDRTQQEESNNETAAASVIGNAEELTGPRRWRHALRRRKAFFAYFFVAVWTKSKAPDGARPVGSGVQKNNKIKMLNLTIPPDSPLTWWIRSGMSRRNCLGMQPNIKAKAIKQEQECPSWFPSALDP